MVSTSYTLVRQTPAKDDFISRESPQLTICARNPDLMSAWYTVAATAVST